MRREYLIFVILLVVVGGVVLGGRDATLIDPADVSAQIYTSQLHGFSIRPPDGWDVRGDDQAGPLAVFTSSVIERDGDFVLPASINILSEPLQGLSPEVYIEESKKNLVTYTKNYRGLEDKPTTVGNLEAHVLGGEYADQGYVLRNRQLIVFSRDTVYVITATSIASVWDKYNDVFEKSMNSFVVQE